MKLRLISPGDRQEEENGEINVDVAAESPGCDVSRV